jgi:hypothetical protein
MGLWLFSFLFFFCFKYFFGANAFISRPKILATYFSKFLKATQSKQPTKSRMPNLAPGANPMYDF